MTAPYRLSAVLLLACLAAAPLRAQTRAAPTHLGVGVLMSIDEKARTLTVSHQAMPTLGMAAMTMDFLVVRSLRLRDLKAGDTIAFVLGRDGKSDDVAIVSLQKVDLASKCPEATKDRK